MSIMIIDSKTQKRFEVKLIEYITVVNKKFNREFTLPILVFRQLGKRAGCAWYIDNKIELNSDFCHNGHLEDMLNQTLPHEIAHIISYLIYGRCGIGHNHHWRNVMRVLNVVPRRCHAYSLVNVKTRTRGKYNYNCKCKTHVVGSTIHNRILLGTVYTCRTCRTALSKTTPILEFTSQLHTTLKGRCLPGRFPA